MVLPEYSVPITTDVYGNRWFPSLPVNQKVDMSLQFVLLDLSAATMMTSNGISVFFK